MCTAHRANADSLRAARSGEIGYDSHGGSGAVGDATCQVVCACPLLHEKRCVSVERSECLYITEECGSAGWGEQRAGEWREESHERSGGRSSEEEGGGRLQWQVRTESACGH